VAIEPITKLPKTEATLRKGSSYLQHERASSIRVVGGFYDTRTGICPEVAFGLNGQSQGSGTAPGIRSSQTIIAGQ